MDSEHHSSVIITTHRVVTITLDHHVHCSMLLLGRMKCNAVLTVFRSLQVIHNTTRGFKNSEIYMIMVCYAAKYLVVEVLIQLTLERKRVFLWVKNEDEDFTLFWAS